jgi:hypothetical protein
MVALIDDRLSTYGVGPICAVQPIAPSTYYAHKAEEADPTRRCTREKLDEWLRGKIQRLWDADQQFYSAYKLNREGIPVARCAATRLMREMGLEGVVTGRRARTTIPEDAADRPLDLVEGDFTATRPKQLWVSDLTYVATLRGLVYAAFGIIDVYSRRIVGWRVSISLGSGLALDTLERAICESDDAREDHLVHHSDRGVRYLSIRNTNDSPRPASNRRWAAEGTRRRVRDAGTGAVVQASSPAGTDRRHYTGRVRGSMLPPPGGSVCRGGTHIIRSPRNPARFSPVRRDKCDVDQPNTLR